MKNRFAILSTVILVTAVVFALGCLGGGGSGTAPAAPADVTAIRATLKGFFDAISSRDPVKAANYFSAQRRASGVAGSSVERLWVRSFGNDINNPADDASYTFDIMRSEISWSEGRYVVPATCFGFDEPIVIVFYLVFENGAYAIDGIGVDGGEGNLAVNASLAEFFPAREGDKLFYAIETQGVPRTDYGILQTVSAPTSIDGRIVYTVVRSPLAFSQLDATLGTGGMPYSYDAPLGSVRDIRRSIAADLFPGNESSQLEGSYRFAVTGGLFYYGPNSSFNGGKPWKILNDPVVTGDVTVATVTFTYKGQTVTCTKTATVGEYDLLVNLPMAAGGAELAVPIEITTTYAVPGNPYSADTGRTVEKAVIYLLKSVGIGAIEDYDPATDRVLFFQTALKGYVNGTVLANPVRVLDPGALEAVAYKEFTHAFEADGGAEPYTWTGTLPAGLSISKDGVISGAPREVGPQTFEVVVHDRYGQAATYSSMISVTGDAFGIVDPGNLGAIVGVEFLRYIDVAGAVGAVTWTSSDLPAWLTLDRSNGLLKGTPTAAGPYSFTITVTDAATSKSATWSGMISVQSEASVYEIVGSPSVTLPTGVVGLGYRYVFTTTNGPNPSSWSLPDANMPPGLTLTAVASSGILEGTPTTAGAYAFRVRVYDDLGSGTISCS
ncbi:MAG TPA: Ig domain-containing protein, partial [Candidatus Ozemobacteraceae bacterium]|nr:Ig domain-containing protein [Candidatus Ozemobacteraceae bacterium]